MNTRQDTKQSNLHRTFILRILQFNEIPFDHLTTNIMPTLFSYKYGKYVCMHNLRYV